MSNNYSEEGDMTLGVLGQAENFTNWMYEVVKPYLRGSILEIGSGLGTYSEKIIKDFPDNKIMLSDADDRYVALSRNKFSNKNIVVKKIDLENPGDLRGAGGFDSIIALNVLEHINADTEVLKNVYDALNNGGRFVLLVPAHKFLFNRLDKASGHCRRYDKKEILGKVARTGFAVEKLFYFNFFAILGWYWNGNVLKKEVLDGTAVSAFNKLVPFFRSVERRLIRGRVGISLVAVLKK